MAKNPLTARETVLRLLEHTQDDASYDDIIRQVRILQDIESTMGDVDLAGFAGDDVVEEARSEIEERQNLEDARGEIDERQNPPVKYRPKADDLILRSGAPGHWRSISDAADEVRDPLLRKAEWLY